MNRERILQLADIIESGKLSFKDKSVTFNINDWITDDTCGTAACIGGHAVIMFDTDGFNYKIHNTMEYAQRLLDLTDDETDTLFFPRDVYWESITVEVAANTLRHFARTGIINFRMFVDPEFYIYTGVY